MKPAQDYQDQHVAALHAYYNRMKEQSDKNLSMTEAVISWLTEGHAENFREEFLKNTSVYS